MDNVTAVSYINQKGGTVSNALCQLAIEIWTWCAERNIILQAEHLPGQLNSQADEQSSTVRDHCNWMLKQSVFQWIKEVMGPLEVDLFASRLTRQLPHFLQLETQPRGRGNGCLYSVLGNSSRVCQPSVRNEADVCWTLITLLSKPSRCGMVVLALQVKPELAHL